MFKNLFSKSEPIKNLSPKEFEAGFKGNKNAVILDVRTVGEYSQGYIPNSINIDIMSPKFMTEVEKFDKSKEFYIYCRSGSRSYQACAQMLRAGFTTVFNLDGGIMDWRGEVKR